MFETLLFLTKQRRYFVACFRHYGLRILLFRLSVGQIYASLHKTRQGVLLCLSCCFKPILPANAVLRSTERRLMEKKTILSLDR